MSYVFKNLAAVYRMEGQEEKQEAFQLGGCCYHAGKTMRATWTQKTVGEVALKCVSLSTYFVLSNPALLPSLASF